MGVKDKDGKASEDELTDDEKAGLSPEELAAIEGDDDDVESLEEIAEGDEDAADAGDDDAVKATDTDDEAADAADTDEAKAAAKAAAAKDADADTDAEGKDKAGTEAKAKAKADDDDAGADDDDDDDDDDDTFVARVEVKAVENYDQRMTEFADQFKALDKKYEDGEINVQEYMAESRKVDAARNDIVRLQERAQWADEQNKSNEKTAWDRAQSRFFVRHKEYGDDPVLFSALDGTVREIASKEGNADRSLSWVLNQAHREVAKRFRPVAPATEADEEGKDAATLAAEKKKADAAKLRKGRRPDLTLVPATLGALPAAELGDAGADNEFAAIDKLEGMDFENALAAMSKTQQDRYLQAK